MNLEALKTLKEQIASAKNLQEPFDYFLDHLGEDEDFIAHGKPVRDPMLETLLANAASPLVRGGTVLLSHLLLIRVRNRPFIHGSFRVNGRPGSVLYFEDVQIGVMTLLPQRPDDLTLFSRFTARQLPPEAVPSDN